MNGIQLPLALIKLNIKEVRDVMFYGSKITIQPEYDKTYDLEAAIKIGSSSYGCHEKSLVI